jgi:hypothetical protein
LSQPRLVKSVVGRVVNDVPPAAMNLLLAAGDISGNGLPDLVLAGRNGRMVWLENAGRSAPWVEHVIDPAVDRLERGGVLHDLTGDGRLDIVNGGDWRSDAIHWWANPGTADSPWTRRLIASTGRRQIHDIAIGKATEDGRTSLFFTNQLGGTDIYRVPLPADPTVSPWPGLEVIATGKTEANPYAKSGRQPEEGLAIGDVDGDGRGELVCGTHWYKHGAGGWRAHRFAAGYITTKIAIGDLDGDGRSEIVLAEGDPCVYGKMDGGRMAWFKAGADPTGPWEEHVLADGLLDAHSLELGDVLGSGRLDILVGEVGVAASAPGGRLARLRDLALGAFRRGRRNGAAGSEDGFSIRAPSILIYENEGAGRFTRHEIDQGTGIHDGLLVDVLNRGVLDIVGKPLHGPEKWNVHVWFNDRAP